MHFVLLFVSRIASQSTFPFPLRPTQLLLSQVEASIPSDSCREVRAPLAVLDCSTFCKLPQLKAIDCVFVNPPEAPIADFLFCNNTSGQRGQTDKTVVLKMFILLLGAVWTQIQKVESGSVNSMVAHIIIQTSRAPREGGAHEDVPLPSRP